jgi:ascorbate-specific PTS system EIIC-type component UlaA
VAQSYEQSEGLPGLVQDLRELVVAYAKQETIEPLKQLGRFVLYGMAGSLAFGLGVILLMLGLLRLLQTETGSTFSGGWSWVPYLAVLVGCASVVALALAARARGRGDTQRAAGGPAR